MDLLLAIDGGGTKTDAVLFQEDGAVLRRVLGRGCNPNDISFDAACAVLDGLLSALLAPYGGKAIQLRGVFAGLSGGTIGDYRERFGAFLRGALPNAAAVRNHSDAVSALSSGIGRRDGCVAVSGTGSCVFVRRGEELFRVGGWGYLLDRGGSGYDFGRDVLYHALCSADGRSRPSLLQRLVEERLGKPVGEAAAEIYAGGKPFIASFAPLAFTALRRGDDAAREIFDSNAAELAKLLNAACRHLPEASPCPTVLAGGIFRDFDDLEPFLVPRLERRHEFVRPTLPPVYGSAREALFAAGIAPCAGLERRFGQTLEDSCERL